MVCFGIIGLDGGYQVTIGRFVSIWDDGLRYEENCVCFFDSVAYTLGKAS